MEPIKANGEPIKLNLVKAAICRFTPGLKRLLIEADCDCQLDGTVLIGALKDGRIELTAKRIEKPVLLLERVDVILREETAGRGVYHGSCELTDGSIYVSLLAENDEVHRFTARNVTEETFREAVRNAVAELEKKSGKLTLTRANGIVAEVAARFGFYYRTVFGVGPDKLKVTLNNRNNHSESIFPIAVEEDDFRRAVTWSAKNLQNMSGPSDWLGYNRIREIVRMECAKEGVACTVAQRPGAEEIEVCDCFGARYNFIWLGGSADTLREEVRNAILAMRQSSKLTLDRAKEILYTEAHYKAMWAGATELDDGTIYVSISSAKHGSRQFKSLNQTAEEFSKSVRSIISALESSNKLTPEKMWQIVQDVCSMDGERPWMIKNDDGSIREIHAYGHKWSAILSTCGLHIEKFREAVTEAREKRSTVRINLTVTGQSNSTATATVSWARFTY